MTESAGKCEVCGYGLITEKHHPEGKKLVMKEVVTIPNGEEITLTKKEYVNKDNVILLCPNCHGLIHKKYWTLEDLREKLGNGYCVEDFRKDILDIIIKVFRKRMKGYGLTKDEMYVYWDLTGELRNIGMNNKCPLCWRKVEN